MPFVVENRRLVIVPQRLTLTDREVGLTPSVPVNEFSHPGNVQMTAAGTNSTTSTP
jgi:hypothetical protein